MTAGILIVTCLMAMTLKHRLTRQLSLSDVVIPFIFLTLFQYEQFALTQNPSHGPLPGMIVQAVALAMLIPRAWVRGLVMALLCFLGVYTGFGFFLGILVPAFITLDLVKHWRSPSDRIALTVSLVFALAGTASFFVGYKHQPAIDCYKFPHDRPVEYIAFASVLFGRAVGAMQAFAHDGVVRIGASITAYGLLLLTALVAAVKVMRRRDQPADRVILFLAAFPIIYGLSAAVGRVCAGLASALSSRYVAYSLSGYLAMYLAAVTWIKDSRSSKWHRWRAVGLGLAVGLMVFKEVLITHDAPDFEKLAAGKREWIQCYLETGDINGCEKKADIMVYPAPEATRMREKLEYLRERSASFYEALP